MGFAQYRWANSPPWALGPNNGQCLQWALGAAENGLANNMTAAVNARFPDAAGMDAGGGTSGSLSLIGLDRQMLPVFGDDSNLNQWRAWIKSGFTPNPAGATATWLPGTPYAVGQLVGVGQGATISGSTITAGFVWRVVTAGTSGSTWPFPLNPSSGQSVTDGTVTWLWDGTTIAQQAPANTTPAATPNPGTGALYGTLAPGWYYAGTNTGLIAALVRSGFYATAPDGSLILPQVFVNTSWVNLTSSGTVGATLLGMSPLPLTLSISVGTGGTPGTSGVVSITTSPAPATYATGQAYPAGSFVKSAHGDVYFAAVGGTAGNSNPFPSSTPSPTVWPIPAGGTILDNGQIQWVYATFSPIPLVQQFSGTWGLDFGTTAISTAATETITYVPAPPDTLTAAWSRLWLALPGDNLVGTPRKWGPSIWTAGMSAVVGQLCASGTTGGLASGYVWVCTASTGAAGGSNPFPASPTLNQTVTDGGITWQWQGGTVPDGCFDGFWGGAPSGQTFEAQWGQTGRTAAISAYATLKAVLFGASGTFGGGGQTPLGQSQGGSGWLAGHARFIGAWLVSGVTQQSDLTPDQIKNATLPTTGWSEITQVSFRGGQLAPFYRFNSET